MARSCIARGRRDIAQRTSVDRVAGLSPPARRVLGRVPPGRERVHRPDAGADGARAAAAARNGRGAGPAADDAGPAAPGPQADTADPGIARRGNADGRDADGGTADTGHQRAHGTAPDIAGRGDAGRAARGCRHPAQRPHPGRRRDLARRAPGPRRGRAGDDLALRGARLRIGRIFLSRPERQGTARSSLRSERQ